MKRQQRKTRKYYGNCCKLFLADLGWIAGFSYLSEPTEVVVYPIKSTHSWKKLPGFQRYFISLKGIVKKVYQNEVEKELQVRIDRAGYATVRLSSKGKTSTCYVHRLVAGVFVPNPYNLPYVNHINGNKLDNRPENLEWVTQARNVKHAYDTGLISQVNKTRVVIDTCTGRKFDSIREAAEAYSIPYSSLKNYLNGNRINVTCLKYMVAA
jgi:hypothetical protein